MEWGIDAQQYAMGYIPVVMFDLWKKYKIMPIADYPTGPTGKALKRELRTRWATLFAGGFGGAGEGRGGHP